MCVWVCRLVRVLQAERQDRYWKAGLVTFDNHSTTTTTTGHRRHHYKHNKRYQPFCERAHMGHQHTDRAFYLKP